MKRNKIWKQIVSVLLSISLIVGMITVSNIREAQAADNAQTVRFELTSANGASWTFEHTSLTEEYQGDGVTWPGMRYQFEAYKDGNTTSESVWLEIVGESAYIWGDINYADGIVPTKRLYVPEGTIMYECKYENGVCTRVENGKTLRLERDITVLNAGTAENPHWYQNIAQDMTIWLNRISGGNWMFGHTDVDSVYIGETGNWDIFRYYQFKAYKDDSTELEVGWLQCVGDDIYIYGGSFPGETAPTKKFALPEGSILEEYDPKSGEVVPDGKRLRLQEPCALQYKDGQWVAVLYDEAMHSLVHKGQSEYTVLLPANPTTKEQFAAQELQHFFKEATGVKLPIQKEGTKELPKKYISVGNTEASVTAGVVPSAEQVGSNGFVIKTIDDDCYIKGFEDMGTRNGVYEWLSQCFDYECYAVDCITITNTTDKLLPNFDLVEVPDFEYREASSELATKSTESYRMQFNTNDELFVTGLKCHNSYMIMKPDTYLADHRDWFSTTETSGIPYQLCYSNAEMRAEYIKNLKDILKTSTKPMMMLGIEDNNFWCECDACQASENTYGSNAAVMIDFVNEVQSEIAEWYATEYPSKEQVQLVIFAYHQTEQPPTGISLDPAVAVMYAPVRASYVDRFDATINAKFNQQLEGWNALTDNLYMWTYAYYAQELLIYYDNLGVVKENYAIYKENGVRYIYDMMAVANENGNSGWERAKTYVMSKLQWDITLDVDTLLNDFFEHYYEDASEIMQDVYNDTKTHMRDIVAPRMNGDAPTDDNFTGVRGNVFAEIIQYVLNQKSNLRVAYTDAYVKAAFADFDTALEVIEKYRYSNPEKYDQLYSRILLERMQFQYIYGRYREGKSWSNYNEPYPREEQWQFRRDFEKVGLITVKETWTANEFWNTIWNMPVYNTVQASVAEVTTDGEIYLTGTIVEGATNKTLESVYGSKEGTGTIQFEQDGKKITETVKWIVNASHSNHGGANIKIVSNNSYIKDNLSQISAFKICLGETVLFGIATPIYIASDISIAKTDDGWVECNEVEITYVETVDGSLYLNADFVSGTSAGKAMQEVYGDWKASGTGTISYTVGGERRQNQTANFGLFAENIYRYNGNMHMTNADFAANFAQVSEFTIEAGTILTVQGYENSYDLSTTPIRIANTLHLEKDADGNWKQEYNVVDLNFDYSDGTGFYLDAEIVSGPNVGDTLTSVYGNWASVPIGYISYKQSGTELTMPVVWSTTNDNGKEQIYVSGDYYTDIEDITSITFAKDTVLVPSDIRYSTTPMKLADEVGVYSYQGRWSDKNQITVTFDSFNGTAIYMNVDIVAGPNKGEELSKVYGEWKEYLPTEVTYVKGEVKETKYVTWQPCSTYDAVADVASYNKMYVPIGDIEYANQVTEIIFNNGTVLTPTNDEYSKVPVELVDNMHLVRTSDAEFLDIAMLDVKVQDNYAQAEAGATQYDMRFIASVNHLNYKKVGFVFSLANEEPEIGVAKCVTRTLSTVYTNMNVGTEKYHVNQIYDGYSNYLFAFGINKVPANQVIYARAYVELPDGRIIYGNVRQVIAPEAK